ncbi:MAG: glycosyltransferase [Acidobacteriota bacterium]|nr:glycosyltransferase [Acidobacteriota bacterium]
MLNSPSSTAGAMNASSPLVSIGMPVWNCEKTIGAAIRSILNQTHGNWELLVIDDGSTDGTLREARRFVDSRIRVHADGCQRGLVPRLNEAVKLSRGEYFARMDGDDVSFPERLEMQLTYLDWNPAVDLVGAGVIVFRGEGEVLGTRALPLTHEEICRRPQSGFHLAHPTWLGRTEWFRDHPYRSDAVRAEDQDLLLRTYRSSRFAALPAVLLGYREESLRLEKILRGRRSFLRSVVREECSHGRTLRAMAAICEQVAKGLLDAIAITTGLDYAILRHRALPADPAIVQRWKRVWAASQGQWVPKSIEVSRPTQPVESKDTSENLEPNAAQPSILYAGTSPLSVQWFLRGQLGYMREAGFDVTVVTAPGEGLEQAGLKEGVKTIAVPMVRSISPRRDIVALCRLWRIVRRLRPSITNVGTPKAGLLAGIAAWLSRVPCRIYTLHGLRLETIRGPMRPALWLAEWIACHTAHRVICVSESLRQKALALRLVAPERAVVLGAGSCNGVDEARYAPGPCASRRARELRLRLGIPDGVPVVGYVGRLTRDKGIPELARAYYNLRHSFPDLHLLLVGDFEKGDPIDPVLRRSIETHPGISLAGMVHDVSPYYHLLDLLLLPTLREGFSNVVLEAHAAGKPVVATRATGVVNAVIDGENGILVPVGDSMALSEAVTCLLRDPALAARMGSAGRRRVLLHFRQQDVWNSLLREYMGLLGANGLPVPQVVGNAPADIPQEHEQEEILAGAPLKPGRWLARLRRTAVGAP